MRLYSDPALDWLMAGTTDLFNHDIFGINYPTSPLDREAARHQEHNIGRNLPAYSLDPGPHRMEYTTTEKTDQQRIAVQDLTWLTFQWIGRSQSRISRLAIAALTRTCLTRCLITQSQNRISSLKIASLMLTTRTIRSFHPMEPTQNRRTRHTTTTRTLCCITCNTAHQLHSAP